MREFTPDLDADGQHMLVATETPPGFGTRQLHCRRFCKHQMCMFAECRFKMTTEKLDIRKALVRCSRCTDTAERQRNTWYSYGTQLLLTFPFGLARRGIFVLRSMFLISVRRTFQPGLACGPDAK